MKLKIVLLFTIVCFVSLSTFYLVLENNQSLLKLKTNHKLKGTNTKHTGYWNGDLQCTAKCQAQDGISCGQAWQNCCRPSQCISEWYGAKNCKDRIPVPGCSEDEN
ncbi:unnamed protein product [Paramecium pentaurelia]|uniref:Transmembrane protein n=1 Tax=Paramecium pentaurelia TaxID=43138 RepID=A0A8S1UFW9_9CILI|nr:unnamed protein product [Paramecium pentaurelia]